MRVMFLVLAGLVVGFWFCVMAREWLKARERNEQNRIAAQEKKDVSE